MAKGRPRTNTHQISIRLPRAWHELADELARKRTKTTREETSRTEIIREACGRGLWALAGLEFPTAKNPPPCNDP